MSLLTVPAILGWALVLSFPLSERPGAAIFLALSGIVSSMYMFACMNHLWIGAASLFYAGNTVLVALAVLDRRRVLRFLFSVPCVIFVLFGVAYWLVFSEARYIYWDEFSQWGLVTREIMSTHELYDLASNAQRPTAPPAVSLWHYFVCANTIYSEGATYFAQFLLLTGALLPLYDGLSFRKPWRIALVVALELLLVVNLGNGVTVLYVDHLLSSFFAGILLVYIAELPSRAVLALLAIPLFVLTLIKEPGLFFAATAVLFIGSHHLAHSARGPADALRRLRRDRRTASILCLLMLAPLVAVGSWQLRLALLENDESPSSVWGIGARVMRQTEQATGYEEKVRERFLEVFLEQPMSRSKASSSLNAFSYAARSAYEDRFRLSTLGWLLFYLFTSCLALWCARDRRLKRAIASLTPYLIAVCTFYALFLLRVYLMSGERGTQLSSYVRYMNTALLPMMLIAFAWFLPATSLHRAGERARWRTPALVTLLAALYLIETPYLEPLYSVRPVYAFREPIEQMTETIVKEIGPGHSLFVYCGPEDLYCGSKHISLFAKQILLYHLTPVSTTIERSLPDHAAVYEALTYDYILILREAPKLEEPFLSAFGSSTPEPFVVYRIESRPEGTALIPSLASSGSEDAADWPTSILLKSGR
jgi:hypothetical protein